MKQLTKCPLDYDITYTFVEDSLRNVNRLTSELLKVIDFKKGYFFTLLPEGSNIERLYEFKGGVILPQNPIIEYESSPGSISTYSIVPTIDKELSVLIQQKV